jgi:hypothetical protein
MKRLTFALFLALGATAGSGVASACDCQKKQAACDCGGQQSCMCAGMNEGQPQAQQQQPTPPQKRKARDAKKR